MDLLIHIFLQGSLICTMADLITIPDGPNVFMSRYPNGRGRKLKIF